MTKTNVQSTPSNSQHHDTPNNKTHVIKFRVTAEEKASLELTCKLLNLSLSTFIRRAIHNAKIEKTVIVASGGEETLTAVSTLLAQCNKVGGNLNQLARHWLPDHVHDGQHKPSTISEYEYNAAHLIGSFGSMRMNAIKAEDIKRYINKLQREKSEDGSKQLSDSTKFQRFKALRNILRYAYQMDYLAVNPLDKIPSAQLPHKPRPKLREGEDFMNKEQVQQYIQCLNEEPLFYRTMVNLMIFTGLRRGEVIGLQWGDIDIEQKTLQVVRNVIRDTKSETGIYIGTPKTEDGARTIALSSYLTGLLKGWKEEQATRRGVLLPTAYVFSNAEDPYWPLYPTTVTAWVHDFEVRHELPKVSPHDLRHTAATLALQSGANLKTVQDMKLTL